ncbi:MAG: methylated-DNA--protein-cysteine methyltransferase [Ilumatobacteraceae bacterium]|nr:methylated-DNA--protein-cysteine methyltransferase [Ilumatobacteraceae bacterium]
MNATIIDNLTRAYSDPSDAAAEQRVLRDRLAASAQSAGVLDVAFRTIDSPFGPLLLAATEEGVVRVAFELEDHEAVLAHLAVDVSPRILLAPRRLESAAEQLDQYFDGRRRTFDLPLDLRLAHGFRRTVLDHLRVIPYGATESYAQVAARSGNPAAVRAAASSCSHNPVPLIVPCHRVVRSDGAIGNYLAGPAVKQALLSIEATS